MTLSSFRRDSSVSADCQAATCFASTPARRAHVAQRVRTMTTMTETATYQRE
jgi:hypothetical protein